LASARKDNVRMAAIDPAIAGYFISSPQAPVNIRIGAGRRLG
jgi:hypothetical protein